MEDLLSVGDKFSVEINEVDDRGKLSLIPVVEETQLSPPLTARLWLPRSGCARSRRRCRALQAGVEVLTGGHPVHQHLLPGSCWCRLRAWMAPPIGASAFQGGQLPRQILGCDRGGGELNAYTAQGAHLLLCMCATQRRRAGPRCTQPDDHQLVDHSGKLDAVGAVIFFSPTADDPTELARSGSCCDLRKSGSWSVAPSPTPADGRHGDGTTVPVHWWLLLLKVDHGFCRRSG